MNNQLLKSKKLGVGLAPLVRCNCASYYFKPLIVAGFAKSESASGELNSIDS
jgi:hypothetical protein